jgi:hypothetical protein
LNTTWYTIDCNATNNNFDTTGDGMFLFKLNISNATSSSILQQRMITINRDVTTAKGLIVMGMMFVTLFFAFLFCYMAVNLDADRQLFKVFFMVLSLFIVLYDLGLTQISLREYVKSASLLAMTETFFVALNWVIYLFIFVIVMDLVITTINYLRDVVAKRRNNDFEESYNPFDNY